jgi:hypothetical protein
MGQIKAVFMKRIVFFISLVLIIFIGYSCIVPSWITREFRYCFDGKKTGLDALINIKGYYAPDTVIREANKIFAKDTLHPAYIFYDNGLVEGKARVSYYLEHEKLSFFAKRGGSYGRYILHSDTIKLQYVTGPGGQSRGIAEIWFKIIDRNTLQRIETEKKTSRSYVELPYYAEQIFIFRPLEIKVKPEETWIYNKSWFRCKKK